MSKQTKPVTKFGRANVRAILEECRQALEPIAEKHGLTLDRKGRTYASDALPVMFQLLIKEMGADGQEMTTDGKAFVRHAVSFDLDPTDLGREFTSRGRTFRITGLLPKSYKYPILATNTATGKTLKFPAETVKAGLKRAA